MANRIQSIIAAFCFFAWVAPVLAQSPSPAPVTSPSPAPSASAAAPGGKDLSIFYSTNIMGQIEPCG